MNTNQQGQTAAVRAVFQAMFDVVCVAPDFNEDRWIDFIAALNAMGRLLFGYPHLESSESDVFGALDDIAFQLTESKQDIERTTADARAVLVELREAIGMVEPIPPDEPETEPSAPVPTNSPVPRAEKMPEQASIAAPNDGKVRSLTTGSPRQGPRYDRDAMFKAIRRTESLRDAATELGLKGSTLLSRLDTLEGHGELPDDIKAKRSRVHVVDESLTFEERRKESAREASERTWRERHPEEARA